MATTASSPLDVLELNERIAGELDVKSMRQWAGVNRTCALSASSYLEACRQDVGTPRADIMRRIFAGAIVDVMRAAKVCSITNGQGWALNIYGKRRLVVADTTAPQAALQSLLKLLTSSAHMLRELSWRGDGSFTAAIDDESFWRALCDDGISSHGRAFAGTVYQLLSESSHDAPVVITCTKDDVPRALEPLASAYNNLAETALHNKALLLRCSYLGVSQDVALTWWQDAESAGAEVNEWVRVRLDELDRRRGGASSAWVERAVREGVLDDIHAMPARVRRRLPTWLSEQSVTTA